MIARVLNFTRKLQEKYNFVKFILKVNNINGFMFCKIRDKKPLDFL